MDDKTKATTEIAEGLPPIHDHRAVTDIAAGLPPVPPIRDDHAEPTEPDDSQINSAWQDKQILFNLILIFSVLISIAVGASTIQIGCGTTLMLTIGAFIFFNICYYTGPVAEDFLRSVGINRNWARWVSFAVGAALAVLVIVSMPILIDRIVRSIEY